MTIRVSEATYRRLKDVCFRLDAWIDSASNEKVKSAFDGVNPKSDKHGKVTMDAAVVRLLVAYERSKKKK